MWAVSGSNEEHNPKILLEVDMDCCIWTVAHVCVHFSTCMFYTLTCRQYTAYIISQNFTCRISRKKETKKTDRQTDRQTRKTDGWMDGWIDR